MDLNHGPPAYQADALTGLSYGPEVGSGLKKGRGSPSVADVPIKGSRRLPARPARILRKEVIQPQVPLRLPCYDLVPITELAVGTTLPCGLGS